MDNTGKQKTIAGIFVAGMMMNGTLGIQIFSTVSMLGITLHSCIITVSAGYTGEGVIPRFALAANVGAVVSIISIVGALKKKTP
jgi:hypothetical protein